MFKNLNIRGYVMKYPWIFGFFICSIGVFSQYGRNF